MDGWLEVRLCDPCARVRPCVPYSVQRVAKRRAEQGSGDTVMVEAVPAEAAEAAEAATAFDRHEGSCGAAASPCAVVQQCRSSVRSPQSPDQLWGITTGSERLILDWCCR